MRTVLRRRYISKVWLDCLWQFIECLREAVGLPILQPCGDLLGRLPAPRKIIITVSLPIGRGEIKAGMA